MKFSTAQKLIQLLKRGKRYRDGLSNSFVELYYEAPNFIHHEYSADRRNGVLLNEKTSYNERDMLNLIASNC